jgi:minor curlin subunit
MNMMTEDATARLFLAGLLLILMAQANATDLSFFNETPTGNKADITQQGRSAATLQREELSLSASCQQKDYANQADIIQLSRENLAVVSRYGTGI